MLDLCTMNEEKQSKHYIGYARVSSIGQNLDAQMDALKQAGCEKIFTDKITGSRMNRPGWDELMTYIRSGDTLVVTELSRMTRSLLHLLETTKLLEAQGVEFISLRERIDTHTATGRCFLSIMGAIHQMERELKAERASAGRKAAKARGKTGGRPKTDQAKLEQARILYEHTDQTAAQVCKTAKVGRRTFFAYLAEYKQRQNDEENIRT